MTRGKVLIMAAVALTAFAIVIAAAPAQATPGAAQPAAVAEAAAAAPAAESNEQIVADFLWRKQRAEQAQRAILQNIRKDLDRKRAEFDEARKRFDLARGRYVEIVGPLAKQGFVEPRRPPLALRVRPPPDRAGAGGEPPRHLPARGPRWAPGRREPRWGRGNRGRITTSWQELSTCPRKEADRCERPAQPQFSWAPWR